MRTINERQRTHYYFEDNIPLKEYDFLFNDLKKEFTFSNNKIILERHLIISELLIEIFIAFLISVFLQFLYNRFSYKFLFFSFYLFTGIVISLLSLFIINITSYWFQPDYSNVLLTENEIRNNYKSLLENKIRSDYVHYITDKSITELSRMVDNIKNGFRKDWDYSTNSFWNAIYTSLVIDVNQYPPITDFLEKNIEKKEIKSRWSFVFTDWNKEFILDNFEIYRDYSPPQGYSVNYSRLLDDIDLMKYNILLNILKDYPEYTLIKNNFKVKFENYWNNLIPKIKLYTTIGLIFFISLIFYAKRNLLLNKAKMYNKLLLMNLLIREAE